MSAARAAFAAALALGVALGACRPAIAGEGTANCRGFITALPAVITEQGVWCLAGDLTDTTTYGIALRVTVPNVTLDCNGRALIHAGGMDTSRVGVQVNQFTGNFTMRDCDVRNFLTGLATKDGSGILLEDNRFQRNRLSAVTIEGGKANMVRRNRFEVTGGSTISSVGPVVNASADVLDNVVDGIIKFSNDGGLIGIMAPGPDHEISRNIVRGFDATGANQATGITAYDARTVIADNVVLASGTMPGYGISGAPNGGMCANNTVVGFGNAIVGCDHSVGNVTP